MKNWKTTLFGLIMSIGAAITTGAIPTNMNVMKIAGYVQAVSGAIFATQTKDKDTAGAGSTAHKVSD